MAGGAVVSAQNAPGELQRTLTTCIQLVAHKDIDFALQEFESEGWTKAALADLGEDAVLALAAEIFGANFFNQPVDDKWHATYKMNLRHASGMRRLKNVPGNGVESFSFIRSNDKSLLKVIGHKGETWERWNCEIIASSELVSSWEVTLPEFDALPTPIHGFRHQKIGGALVQMTLFDAERVSTAIDEPFFFAARIGVHAK